MNALPPLQSVTIAGTSPALAVEDVEVVVTLPTFRRPQQLLATLDSLAKQKTARRFAVIVMENDDEGYEGMRAALPLFESGAMNGLVIVAHERGNYPPPLRCRSFSDSMGLWNALICSNSARNN